MPNEVAGLPTHQVKTAFSQYQSSEYKNYVFRLERVKGLIEAEKQLSNSLKDKTYPFGALDDASGALGLLAIGTGIASFLLPPLAPFLVPLSSWLGSAAVVNFVEQCCVENPALRRYPVSS
jgi:hypothetical protein